MNSPKPRSTSDAVGGWEEDFRSWPCQNLQGLATRRMQLMQPRSANSPMQLLQIDQARRRYESRRSGAAAIYSTRCCVSHWIISGLRSPSDNMPVYTTAMQLQKVQCSKPGTGVGSCAASRDPWRSQCADMGSSERAPARLCSRWHP